MVDKGFSMADWKQIRFQYETLGMSQDDIAASNRISSKLLENCIEQEGWVRQPIANVLGTWKSEAEPEKMVAQAREKAELVQTLRRTDLGCKYYTAEENLLTKIISTLECVDPQDELAAKTLKTLADTLIAMRPAEPVDADAGGSGTGITIQIAAGYGQHAAARDEETPTVCVDTPAPKLERLN